MKTSKEEKQTAMGHLRAILNPGDTVYCILRHCSASGMMRVIDFIVIKDNRPVRLSIYICDLLGMPYHRKYHGVAVRGCGMDMGFGVVYDLGCALWPEGFGLWPLSGEYMPKEGNYRKTTSAQDAQKMIAQGFRFCGRNGDTSGWDNDGGYALRSEWI